jgi:hypothetical protein
MRATSSALAATLGGTSSASVRIRLKSGNCCMMTSLASVNGCVQKVIVDLGGPFFGYERDEMQERFPAQMCLRA